MDTTFGMAMIHLETLIYRFFYFFSFVTKHFIQQTREPKSLQPAKTREGEPKFLQTMVRAGRGKLNLINLEESGLDMRLDVSKMEMIPRFESSFSLI